MRQPGLGGHGADGCQGKQPEREGGTGMAADIHEDIFTGSARLPFPDGGADNNNTGGRSVALKLSVGRNFAKRIRCGGRLAGVRLHPPGGGE